ncbi:MAG TPA: MBL fold metallo-hydrolase [Baekduia sp.]|nr:MBL fold metallo-hydrolase [Baekduia sp.]
MRSAQLADGVDGITFLPRHGVNVYVLGDVLVDAGYAQLAKGVIAAVRDRGVTAHALTHAHPDHAGGSARVTRELGIPMWAPEGDAAAVEAGRTETKAGWMAPFGKFPAARVDRRLREGDEVGGFTVLEVPGHSPGHVAYWREADRVLVCGDVFFNLSLATLRYGLRHPPGPFTPDPARNRESQRRLAGLDPELVLFGHGPVLRGRGRLRAFVDAQSR